MASQLKKEVQQRRVPVDLHYVPVNPVDHKVIFAHLKELVPRIRKQYEDMELVIHASPGTGAMHTIWVLMAETGLIRPPFTLMQSLKRSDRGSRPPVIPLEIGLETPLKTFQRVDAVREATSADRVRLEPIRYQAPKNKALYEHAYVVAQLKVPVLLLRDG